ncbi:hypothetical protein [Bacillus marinisedimentorum]|uniref:hypothetical protein n=1 Tax=Bacillus marinisedimentorum TaxID=1821260 RepID=UPI0007DFBA2B|nr:hypothetical protein [Bacillus marinisedimentorum]
MKRLIGAALAGGGILGFFLKWVQAETGKNVYILLLNIDYIPVAKDLPISEAGEFLLHLGVSIPLTIFLLTVIPKFFRQKPMQALGLLLSSIFIGIILYPTTVLSVRTPALSDGWAFFWWIGGHLLYGAVLAAFLPRYSQTVLLFNCNPFPFRSR